MSIKAFLWEIGVLAGTTVGAGMFALPYLLQTAGWLPNLLYLTILGVLISFAHLLYFRVLERDKIGGGLLGPAKHYLGERGLVAALFALLGGLLLTLVVYLILGSHFLGLLFPSAHPMLLTFLFWVVATLPVMLRLERMIESELVGFVIMIAIVLLIAFTARIGANLSTVSLIDFKNAFVPFGPILFSLAAWTAVEPIFRFRMRNRRAEKSPRLVMFAGTGVAIIFYLLFILTIFGSADRITPDTLSGLTSWPAWKLSLLSVLGIFAIWTSYVPIGFEIRNSLMRGLKWPQPVSIALVALFPLILVLLGVNNFLGVMGLVGAVFLSFEYLLIVFIAEKAFKFAPDRKSVV